MKKKLMLLMLGLAFSFGSYASNEVEKKKTNQDTEQYNKEFSESNTKLYSGFCIESHAVAGDCPDGSFFIQFVVSFLVDCDTGFMYAGVIEEIYTLSEACD
jgi:hypothetical protein